MATFECRDEVRFNHGLASRHVQKVRPALHLAESRSIHQPPGFRIQRHMQRHVVRFLQQRVEVEKRDVGIAVGIVDESGSRVVSYGKMDNGTDEEVNGDTAVLSAYGFSAKKDLLAQLLASWRANPDPIAMRSEVFYFGVSGCCLNFSLLLPVLQNISRLAFQRFANRLQGR